MNQVVNCMSTGGNCLQGRVEVGIYIYNYIYIYIHT